MSLKTFLQDILLGKQEIPTVPGQRVTSDAGLRYLSSAEGGAIKFVYDDHVYPTRKWNRGDPIKGFLTVGLGHLIMDSDPLDRWLDEGISDEEITALLKDDLQEAESAVNRLVTVPLKQHQFDALVCFVFNVGETQFRKSTLLRKLNTGDYDSVVSELKRWRKSGGRVMKGLIIRRDETGELFGEADYEWDPDDSDL